MLHQSGSLYRLPHKPFSVDPAGAVSMDGDDDDSHPAGMHSPSLSADDLKCKVQRQAIH